MRKKNSTPKGVAKRLAAAVLTAAALAALAVAAPALGTDVGGTGGVGTGHEHPIGASPMRISVVPAFKPCSTLSSNANHDPSLPGRACNPPVPSSSLVAVGPNSIGVSRIRVLQSGECAPFNATKCYPDVVLSGSSTDIRAGSPTGAPFSGALTAVATIPDTNGPSVIGNAIQITDARNSLDTTNGSCISGSYSCSATVGVLPFPVPVTCTSGTCSTQTTANTLAPGSIIAGRRGIVETGQIEFTDSQNKVFAAEGIDIP